MKEWVRFDASRQPAGWCLGANIFCHDHAGGAKHAKFTIDLGWWYLEMEIGYEPQGE